MNFVSDEKFVAPSKNVVDFFNKVGELTEVEAEALVKVIRNENGKGRYYIREHAFGEHRGNLVDPDTTLVKVYDRKLSGGMEEMPFKKVSDKAVVYYIEFLKRRQTSYLRMAEREKNV